jgi:very-short-patch-repair endonuclease
MDERGERWALATRRARALRSSSTPAERLLWRHLRRRGLAGARFRRQHPIESFVVDFYCPQAHLVVEVDGPSHDLDAAAAHDERRLRFLEARGLMVLHLSNDDVLHHLAETLDTLRRIVISRGRAS